MVKIVPKLCFPSNILTALSIQLRLSRWELCQLRMGLSSDEHTAELLTCSDRALDRLGGSQSWDRGLRLYSKVQSSNHFWNNTTFPSSITRPDDGLCLSIHIFCFAKHNICPFSLAWLLSNVSDIHQMSQTFKKWIWHLSNLCNIFVDVLIFNFSLEERVFDADQRGVLN